MEGIIRALEAKETSNYSTSKLNAMIKGACSDNKTRIKVDVMLVNDNQVKLLKAAGYDLYNTHGMLEISWEYAE